jgi:uncharacterized membrane protein
MKTLTKFLKMTFVGGLLVVLPIWVSLLLLLKAIKGAMAMLLPIAKLLPQWFVHEKVVALVLLLVICFVVGLLIRTGPGRRFGDWLCQHILDRIPGFSLMRRMTRQLAGKKGEQAFQPALVEIEDALVPAFIIEKHADGQFTVFVSSGPTPMAGAYIFCNQNACIRWMCLCARRWSVSPSGGLEQLRCVLRFDLEARRKLQNEGKPLDIGMSSAEPVLRDWHVGWSPLLARENLSLSLIHFELNQ